VRAISALHAETSELACPGTSSSGNNQQRQPAERDQSHRAGFRHLLHFLKGGQAQAVPAAAVSPQDKIEFAVWRRGRPGGIEEIEVAAIPILGSPWVEWSVVCRRLANQILREIEGCSRRPPIERIEIGKPEGSVPGGGP